MDDGSGSDLSSHLDSSVRAVTHTPDRSADPHHTARKSFQLWIDEPTIRLCLHSPVSAPWYGGQVPTCPNSHAHLARPEATLRQYTPNYLGLHFSFQHRHRFFLHANFYHTCFATVYALQVLIIQTWSRLVVFSNLLLARGILLVKLNWSTFRPCLVHPKNQKRFKIPRHIKSYGTWQK